MFLLSCPVKAYAWGSRTAIAGLSGRPSPSAEPEAELWMGAHRDGASSAYVDGQLVPLPELFEQRPEQMLGADCVQRFGGLPFLFKLLAAEHPLSLQVHPSLEQARAGFAREEALGVPRGAATRNYRDQNHKPELLVALGRFEALSGWRAFPEQTSLLRRLDLPALRSVADTASGTRELFSALLLPSASARTSLLEGFAQRAQALSESRDEDAAAFAWAARLARAYPSDVGAVLSLLLRYLVLDRGEALFLGAGNLHAYLRGFGVEIMASSDNVLRGGLTPKHVDVTELLATVDFDAAPPALVRPEPSADGSTRYQTPVPDFALTRLAVAAHQPKRVANAGPQIALVTEGNVVGESPMGSVELRAGQCAFVPAAAPWFELAGAGEVFLAGPGEST